MSMNWFKTRALQKCTPDTKFRGILSSLEIICVSYTLKHSLQFTGLRQGKKCYPNRTMLHLFLFLFVSLLFFCRCHYLLCDTLTSSATFHTPEVTKQSWKLRCPVQRWCDQDIHIHKRAQWNWNTHTHTYTPAHTKEKPPKITFLWEGNHLQLCLWINICVSVFANWIHNWKMLRPISMMKSILVC